MATITMCIPQAAGVPGLPGPPNWLPANPGAPPWLAGIIGQPQKSGLDDPRWVGAGVQGFGGGGTGVEEATFQALYTTGGGGHPVLVLSWQVQFDPSLSDVDALYFGFQDAGGTALLVKIVPHESLTAATDGAIGSAQAYTWNGSQWTAAATTPAWLTLTARAWLANAPSDSWAVQVIIPYNPSAASILDDNGPNLGTTFNAWYYFYLQAYSTAIPYEWPPLDTPAGQIILGTGPNPSSWSQGRLHLQSGSGDPMCQSGGVSLQWQDVGTNPTGATNALLSNQILYNLSGTGPTNTIVAAPRNYTGAALNPNTVTARFRLADWGSVADPNAPWTDIPNGTAVQNGSSIPPLTGGQQPPQSITFPWQLNAADVATFITGKASSDMCMLVNLSGPGINFLVSSVYRNMDFVTASTFRRTASINIMGLAPLPGGGTHRDVYLAVETVNMPARVPPGTDGGPPVPRSLLDAIGIREGGGDAQALRRRFVGLARAGALSARQIDQFMPTYRVHVYYDTGGRVTRGGATYPVLRSQSSFGYYVDHQGPLTGWLHDLQGAQQIAPNFYKLRVPNNGAAHVATTITATEGQGCLAVLLALLRKLLGT